MNAAITGRGTMEHWEALIAASRELGTSLERGPVSRGAMYNVLLTVRLEGGRAVEARHLGSGGAPTIVFDEPQRVYADIAAGRLDPFAQALRGELAIDQFAGRYLSTRTPERFYVAPLLYLRPTEELPLPRARVQGPDEWRAFVAAARRPLAGTDAGPAPWQEAPMMQRIFWVAWRDGRALQVAEAPAGGDGGVSWEPAQQIWESLALGELSPTRAIETAYPAGAALQLTLFIHKDAGHIGYEFAIR